MHIFFHEYPSFQGERGKLTHSGPTNATAVGKVSFYPPSEAATPPADDVYERYGYLQGEFLCLMGGFVLVSRDGQCIKANVSQGNVFNRLLEEKLSTEAFKESCAQLIRQWDHYPKQQKAAILNDTNARNYYHFTVDLLPRIRLLQHLDYKILIISQACYSSPHQVELFAKAFGSSKPLYKVSLQKVFKVQDPRLVHVHSCWDSIRWLREKVSFNLHSGERRIYIRRNPIASGTTSYRELSEDHEFILLLKRYSFETVTFQTGESVADQAGKLDGAGIILGAHGANLTNIIYLCSPLTLIEIVGARHEGDQYQQISECLGFHYHAVKTDQFDVEGRIVVPSGVIDGILERETHGRNFQTGLSSQ